MAVFLVTGGAGFIGSHLVEVLLGEGHEVRILDVAMPAQPFRVATGVARVRTITGDLRNLELVRQAAQGVDTVFHLAMPLEWQDAVTRVLTQHTATTGTMHVLIAAREAGVGRVVYTSCASVYGTAASQPVSEDTPLAPVSEFAQAKDTGEKDCFAFNYLYGLETVRLRLFNVYGPRQRPGSPHARFLAGALQAALSGRIPHLPGDGWTPMDLLFVSDAVHALLLAARTPRAASRVYNIGYGQPTTAFNVLETLNSILATNIQPSYSTPKPQTEFDNLPDVRRAEAEFGFCPAVRLEAGLRQTIDYYLQQPPPPLDLGEPGSKPEPAPGEKKSPTP